MRRSLSLAAFLLIVPMGLGAQISIDSHGSARGRGEGHWRILPGLHYVTATGPTLHVAVLRITRTATESQSGDILSVEGGRWGGKIGIGRGGISGYGAGLARLSYLRSWGSGGRLAPGQGYLGADIRISFNILALGVGWHKRISGNAPGDGSITTLSAGIGF